MIIFDVSEASHKSGIVTVYPFNEAGDLVPGSDIAKHFLVKRMPSKSIMYGSIEEDMEVVGECEGSFGPTPELLRRMKLFSPAKSYNASEQEYLDSLGGRQFYRIAVGLDAKTREEFPKIHKHLQSHGV